MAPLVNNVYSDIKKNKKIEECFNWSTCEGLIKPLQGNKQMQNSAASQCDAADTKGTGNYQQIIAGCKIITLNLEQMTENWKI